MTIPATFSTATVSPCFAIRVSREALPFRFVPKDEKTSFCVESQSLATVLRSQIRGRTYGVIEKTLVLGTVVDVDGDVTKVADFGCEGS